MKQVETKISYPYLKKTRHDNGEEMKTECRSDEMKKKRNKMRLYGRWKKVVQSLKKSRVGGRKHGLH